MVVNNIFNINIHIHEKCKNIDHILYNTVGTNFEEYLSGDDMLSLSSVSKITRDGELTTNFRNLLIHTKLEYEVCKRNNKVNLYNQYNTYRINNIDDFFANIPLRVIYKNINLDQEIYRLLDYLNISEKARLHIFIELSTLDDFEQYIDDLHSNIDIDECFWEYLTYIEQASIRLRPDIVQY